MQKSTAVRGCFLLIVPSTDFPGGSIEDTGKSAFTEQNQDDASRSFVMRDGNQVLWQAGKQEDEFRPLEKSPMLAASGTKRLAQMRAIAREFVAFDDFASTNQTVRQRTAFVEQSVVPLFL